MVRVIVHEQELLSSVRDQDGVESYLTDTPPKTEIIWVNRNTHLHSTLAPFSSLENQNKLVASAKEYGVDAICIQEHRVYHGNQEEIRDHLMDQTWTNVSRNLPCEVIFLELLHRRCRKTRPGKTFIKQLEEDTSISSCDMTKLMEDRINWKRLAMVTRVNP